MTHVHTTQTHERDLIRIVPLHVPKELTGPVAEAGPTPAPQLTYRNGPLLTAVQVFTVFWGSAWQQGAQATMAQNLNQFFQFILTSPLIDQLSEYNVPQYTIGHGSLVGTTTVTTPAPKKTETDAAIRTMLQSEISQGGAFPAPNANLLYFIYMPPGIAVSQGGSRSCQAFCGYHDAINGQIFYAVMPYPNCQGCTGTLAPFDALTSTSSHEMCEAITDAVPGTGWYDDNNGEIGDICAWETKTVGAYTVQKEWSNKNNSCM